jgi:DNA polymerase I
MAGLLVLDSMGLLYRGHFAMSGKPLTAADGTVTSGIFNLVREILDLRASLSPDITVAAMDFPGPTFRNGLYPAYKANRPPMPDELRTQADLARRLIPAMGIPMLQQEGLEADDIIASLAALAVREGRTVHILTSDKDLLQLVGDGVTVLRPGRPGKPVIEVGPQQVQEILGVLPGLVVDLFALTGDSSDNVPGAKGIGPKTALALLREYGSLDSIFARISEVTPVSVRRKLEESREMVLLSRRLVDLSPVQPLGVSLSGLAAAVPDLRTASDLLSRLGMASLLKRLSPPAPGPKAGTQGELFQHAPAWSAAPSPFEVTIAASAEDLERFLAGLPDGAPVAVDTETTSKNPLDAVPVGLAIASSGSGAFYVPLGGPDALPVGAVRGSLNGMLSGRPVLAQNGKYDIQVLQGIGVPIGNLAGDPMVADYLLRPEGRSHSLGSLSLAWLGRTLRDYDEVAGDAGDLSKVETAKVAAYCAADACTAWELSRLLRTELEEDSALLGLYDRLELPLVSVLAAMERRGVAIDMKALAELEDAFSWRIHELETAASAEAGAPVNLNSPSQISSVLFDTLGLAPVRKTPGGSRSSGVDVLEALEGAHPFVSLVLEHRELSKLLNTYVRKLPGFISLRDGLVHTSFSQTVTATGRLSSSGPNLQNIPIRTSRGREVRRCFHPGAPGEVFVTADYSQIELRVLAHMAGPGSLREAFMEGRDIHDATAVALFGDSSKEHRRKAKEVNFSILYGISPWGLSRRLGIGMAEAAGIIDRYMASYPELEFFFRKCIADAEATGETRTLLGRKRVFTDFASARGNTRKAMERMVVNTTVQGSAADMIKQAMLRVHARLGRDFPGAGLVLQVHDELVAVVPAEAAEDAAAVMAEEMVQALELEVPVAVDTGIGRNWMEAQH